MMALVGLNELEAAVDAAAAEADQASQRARAHTAAWRADPDGPHADAEYRAAVAAYDESVRIHEQKWRPAVEARNRARTQQGWPR